MRFNRPSWALRLAAYAGLAFMHLPVLVIVLYAFTTEDRTYEFPPPGLTLHWFEAAFARSDIWQAMRLSLSVAAVATLVAIVLGSLTALGMARGNFRGKESITVLLVLPIALPGIVTGVALLAAIRSARIDPGFWTIVAGQMVFTASGRPVRPSQTSIRTSAAPRFLISVRTWSQYFAPSPPSPIHRPRMSRCPSAGTATAM